MSELARVNWACPRCGAEPGDHGKGGRDKCAQEAKACEGFLCECDDDGGPGHGESYADPCPNANCYHCDWGGTFPPPPFSVSKLPSWAKKAWAEGWLPPAGWQPQVRKKP